MKGLFTIKSGVYDEVELLSLKTSGLHPAALKKIRRATVTDTLYCLNLTDNRKYAVVCVLQSFGLLEDPL